jgi:uncharacterized protein (DUF952 family)
MNTLVSSKSLCRIVTEKDWNKTKIQGTVPQNTLDKKDGFIHLSTVDQVLETLNCYFREEQKPLILILNESHLEDTLKWEIVPTRNNQSFPHLYRLLYYDDIDGVLEVRYEDEFYLGEYRKIDK